MSGTVLRRSSPDDPDARRLIEALNAELRANYPDPGTRHFRLGSGEVAEGRGAFLVALLDGEPAGCGAVRAVGDGCFEVKRMYVAPPFRRRGVGGAVLAALEAEARRLGGRRMLLETGNLQVGAIALYEREGYVPIPPFGSYRPNAISLCMGKDLPPAA